MSFHVNNIIEILKKGLSWLIYGLGFVFLLMLIISFTSLPYWGIYNLATTETEFNFEPETIVVMGGAGMPSKTALIRTYYASEYSKIHPSSSIIIALPDNLGDESSHLKKMEKELRLRAVESAVFFENKGTNTRAQALLIKKMLQNNINRRLVIVSSPEHIYRAVRSFQKIGFVNVGGMPAFERDLEMPLEFNSEKLGGKDYLPDVGSSNQLRYQFWNHLQYEIILLREYSAILYYKIQSWI